MKVSDLFCIYGEDIISLIEATSNRMKLIRKYMITGEKESAADRFILWEINDTLQSLSLSHERLSDALFTSRKERDLANLNPKNKYFTFDNGNIHEVDEEEARALGILTDTMEDEAYENDDF